MIQEMMILTLCHIGATLYDTGDDDTDPMSHRKHMLM
jgi:hypothetical protein